MSAEKPQELEGHLAWRAHMCMLHTSNHVLPYAWLQQVVL
jgi:hypothetical protein